MLLLVQGVPKGIKIVIKKHEGGCLLKNNYQNTGFKKLFAAK